MPPPSTSAAKFKLRDASSYDAVTAEFDFFTRQLSMPVVERMIAIAELQPSERVLDVGTGTGIIALNAAQAVAPQGRVVGIDLSAGMLVLAQAKAREISPAERIEFLQMDAEALKFEDESFDVVLSLYALLHFPNPSLALAEMFRVLRPGGRLVLASGSRPPLLSMSGVWQAIKHVNHLRLKTQGKLLIAPQFLDALVRKYFPQAEEEESTLAHASLNRTRSLLRLVHEAKFTRIKSCWYGHEARLNTSQDFWIIQRTFSSVARKRLASAPTDKVEALREEFFDTCRKVQARHGQLVYPSAAFSIKAYRPLA